MPSTLSSSHLPRNTGEVRVGIGGQRQQARVPQQPAAIITNGDPPESFAVNTRDAVMMRQTLVHERVVRGQELRETPIPAELAFQEQERLAFHVGPKVLVKLVEHVHVRNHSPHASELQPLGREVRPPARLRVRRPASAKYLGGHSDVVGGAVHYER